MTGTIVKAYSGFYYVATEKGVIECSLRGNIKKGEIEPLVGDKVEVGPGRTVDKVLPRKTVILRPRIANVDQVVIVFSFKKPELDLCLLDRFILLAELIELEPVICLNKKDLLPKNQKKLDLGDIYVKAGYKIVYTSAKTKFGIAGLVKLLKGRISVLAGPSGTGKTSLLNAVDPKAKLKVGTLSVKTDQGKHTTIHTELLQLGKNKNILVADTPGFTELNLTHVYFWRLQDFFPEFRKFIGKCKFGADCLHDSEPGCAIKEAVEKKVIAKSRYDSYKTFLKEIKEKRSFRYQYRMK